jgi:hypothetical protein
MNRRQTIIFSIWFVLLFQNSFSQISKSEFDIISFQLKNDFIFKTDQYFTHAFKLKLESSKMHDFVLNDFLFWDFGSEKFYQFSVEQNLYTPKNIHNDEIQFEDRPFSADILFSYNKMEFDNSNKRRIFSQIQIGILGKSAFGEEMQNGIHALLPTSGGDVSGWKNQISDEFLMNYKLEFEQNLVNLCTANLNLLSGFQIGEPQTLIDGGFSLIFSDIMEYFSKPELLSTNDFIFQIKNEFKLNYVIYNSLLQGGIFNKQNAYVLDEIIRTVPSNKLSVQAKFYKTIFNLGFVSIAREFPKAENHKWLFFEIQTKL